MSTESPDMKFARHRLEDLLSNIKEQAQTPDSSDKEDKEDDELYEEEDVKSPWTFRTPSKRSSGSTSGKIKGEPVRKRPRSGKKILFELRQKPFELPNTTEDYSLYKLCRIWLHGKDYSSNYGDFTPRSSPQKTAGDTTSEKNGKESSKEIYKMPPPVNIWDVLGRVPSPVQMEHPLDTMDASSKEAILASYMPHWKSVKQRWCKHARQLEKQCYGKNLQILQNMVAVSSAANQYTT